MSKPPRLTLPPCARAYRLRTPRGEFAVHEAGPAGDARGTALLVPGFTGSKEDFIGLLEPLAQAGFRVVAVDGRGQHESDGPREESAYALEELAQDVLAQASAVADGGPVHLVGHSFGGLVARTAVLREPAAFASLTLLSSGPAAISEAQQERTKLLVAALEVMGDDMPAIWQAMRDMDPEDAAPDGPELAAFLRGRWLATVPEQLIAAGRVLVGEPDRVDALRAAAPDLPMLVLSGETDSAWPVPLMDAMARRLGARRSVIPGTDHSPNAEDPAATAAALAAFWAGSGRA